MWGDDPPFLTVGTEVSAKYKGAFCEAKVRKVVRSVKCKITFKLGLGTLNVTDDQIRGGTLRVGSVCEVKHPEKKEYVEAIINKIQDCSQYTVVFDDGDITTLRRTALCLKSGRHFAESETLDQLPLTHPEHFSNPVIGGRKGRRSRQAQEDSSDEDDVPKKGKKKNEKEADIGKVVCVELGDKKKQKDNWFPGLVVAPTAQDTVRIRVKDEYLVRSFKDGRYFTVPKKEATEFTREIGSKVDNHTLKAAVEKALQYLDRDELPPHWDRDLLFGLDESSGNSDSDGALDSDSSDDEPREEKDHFVAQLYKFMDDRGTPINRGPTIGAKDVDLYKLFKVVHKLGGYNRVTNHNQWKIISQKLGFGQGSSSTTNLVKQSYKKFLHSFEDFYRKLGCTMVNHPRGHRSRHRTGRSLIRDRDRATPTIIAKEKEKEKEKKEEKPIPKPEEAVEKGTSGEKEEENVNEDKKECPKVKEPVKKNKGREEKSENQNKQKGKDQANVSHSEVEEKDNRSRSRKESKVSVIKPPEETLKEEKVPIPVAAIKQEPEAIDETKSRETKLKTRDLKPKVKTSEKSKVKEEKSKPPEDEKLDEIKKKSEKKPDADDVEKIRSKSKEDCRNKKEGVPIHDTRTMKEKTNKPPIIRKEDESVPQFKKRGRKRKDLEEKPKAEEAMGHLASHVTVCVGDKLKVYYGPTHESKVTYEAKVLEIEEDGSECMYLVHYTGWNTRYDEWIKRGRIADNLSWTPTRAKRQRQQQSQHKASRPSLGKRGRPSGTVRGQDGLPNPPRSTTPSSVTSSSSQNKSPASRLTPRSSRGMGEGPEFRRRTRRMSGHTDISVASDSESEEFQSDVESEVAQTRSRTTEQRKSTPTSIATQQHSDINLSGSDASCKSEVVSTAPIVVKDEPVLQTPSRKKSNLGSSGSGNSSTKVAPQLESTGGETDVKTEQGSKGKAYSDLFEKRRSRRGKASVSSSLSPHSAKTTSESKVILDNESEESREPKGRDFDLNQIRSELKGIEKAVKVPQDIIPSTFHGIEDENKEKSKVTKSASSNDWEISEKDEDLKVKPKKEIKEEVKTDRKVNIKEIEDSPAEEDVYEFKDTEPLELEVRKRDTLSLSESKSLQRRSTNSTRHLETFSVTHESILTSSPNLLPVSSGISVSNPNRVSNAKSPRKRLIHMSSKDIDVASEGGKKMRATSKKKGSLAEGKNSMCDVPKSETVTPPPLKSGKSRIAVSDPCYDDICSPSLLPGAVALGVAGKSSSGLTRLQTSALDLESTCDRPNSPPLLSLPDVDEDEGEDDHNDGDDGINGKSRQLGHLSIFSENHDDGDDDHEDRLVISESDDMVTEIAEPLFSHQQRDHEDLFPTLVSSAAVVTAASTSSMMKTEELPCLSSAEVAPTIFHDFGSTILESSQHTSLQQSTQRTTGRSSLHCVLSSPGEGQDGEDVIKDLLDHQHVDYGDDSINAAISRVLDHSIMDEDEDTSGDMELFCPKQMSGMSTPAVSSSLSFQNSSSGNKSIVKNRSEDCKQATCMTFADSDSVVDSSDDEDQRLVIDPAEDDGNSQTPTRSSPFSSSPLRLSMDNLNEPDVQDSSCETDSQVLAVENSKKISHETTVTPTVIVSCSSSTMSESEGKLNKGTLMQNVSKSKNDVPDHVSMKEETTMSKEDNYKIQIQKEDKNYVKQSGSKYDQKETGNAITLPTNLGRIPSGITPVIVKMNVDNAEVTADKSSGSDTKVSLKEVPLSKSTNKGASSLNLRETDSNKKILSTVTCTTPLSSAFSKNSTVAQNITKSVPTSSPVTSSQSSSVSSVPSEAPSVSSKVWKSLKNTPQDILTEVSYTKSATSTSATVAPFSRSFGATYSAAKMNVAISGNFQKASGPSDKNINDKNTAKGVTTTIASVGTNIAVHASSVVSSSPNLVTSVVTSANIVPAPVIVSTTVSASPIITSVSSVSNTANVNVLSLHSFSSVPLVSSISSSPSTQKGISHSGTISSIAPCLSVTSLSRTPPGSSVPISSTDTVGSITTAAAPPKISTIPIAATVPSNSFAPTITITSGALAAPKRMAVPTGVSSSAESSAPSVTSSQVVVSAPTMSNALSSTESDDSTKIIASTLTTTAIASGKIVQSIPTGAAAPTDISTTSSAVTELSSIPRVSAVLRSSSTKAATTSQVSECTPSMTASNSITSVLPSTTSVSLSAVSVPSIAAAPNVSPSSLAVSGPYAVISQKTSCAPPVTLSSAVNTAHLTKTHLSTTVASIVPSFSVGSAQSAMNVRVATTTLVSSTSSALSTATACDVSSPVVTPASSLVTIPSETAASIMSISDSLAISSSITNTSHSVLSATALPILSLVGTSHGSPSVASAVITSSTTPSITSAVVSNISSGLDKTTNSVNSSPSSLTAPVTILLGSSCLNATSSDYNLMISSASTDDSVTSDSNEKGIDGSINIVSNSLISSASTPSSSISSVTSSSNVVSPAVTIPSTVTVVSSSFSSSSSVSQQTSNLKLMCDAIKHSDSSVIALTSLSLGESEIISGDLRIDPRSDDADSQLLGSLLCQETIPGSPAQIADGGYDEAVQESKVLVLEMPFASVPASTCDATNSSVPLTVPMSVPLSLPMVNVATLAEVKTTEIQDGAQSSDVNTPLPVPSGPETSSLVSAACSAHHVLVIPSASASKLNPSEAAPVMENTPPTTPDSSLSTISGSPREDHRGMSPGIDNESSKSHRDSFEMDLDSCPEDSLLNVEVSNACNNRLQGLELLSKKEYDLDKECDSSPKKRRRSRKRSESENLKRVRCTSSKTVRPNGGTGSDSDDTSENSALDCTPLASSESTLSSKSPRPSKYNFYVELDPELDGSQRIALLQQKLQELRKTYMSVKAELACIDRRRKKLRRREREVEKSSKQEVTCS